MQESKKVYTIEYYDYKTCEVDDEGDALCDEDGQDEIDRILTNYKTFSKDDELRQQAESEGYKVSKYANAKGSAPEVDPTVCADRHDSCPNNAKRGECEKNPGWMIVNCALSCNACHLRDPKVRCDRSNLNISTSPIYNPGDMQAMFERIETEFSHYGITVISKSPWIVTFDNFLTDAEVICIYNPHAVYTAIDKTFLMVG
jgi:hypothetical protein